METVGPADGADPAITLLITDQAFRSVQLAPAVTFGLLDSDCGMGKFTSLP